MWDLNDQSRIAPATTISPMAPAMACAKESKTYAGNIRMGIGVIKSETGVFDYEGVGNYVPTSIHHMMLTSLKASGFRVINRIGEVTAIIEWENAKAMAKLLGDGQPNYVKATRPMTDYDGDPIYNKNGEQQYEEYDKPIDYRILTHGQMLGSTHLLSGSLTRIDFDTSSGGFELYYDGIGVGKRIYRMLVGLDLHVTNTITGEVEWSAGYDKQYFGVETKAGAFRLLNDNLIDINFGQQTNEPIQAGIAYLVDFAAYDMARYFLGVKCDDLLPNSILGESAGHGNG